MPSVDPNLPCVKRAKSVCRTQASTGYTNPPNNLGCTQLNFLS